jgi:hypothetical protein
VATGGSPKPGELLRSFVNERVSRTTRNATPTFKMTTPTTSNDDAMANKFYRKITLAVRPLKQIAARARTYLAADDSTFIAGVIDDNLGLWHVTYKLWELLGPCAADDPELATRIRNVYKYIGYLFNHIMPLHKSYLEITDRVENGGTDAVPDELIKVTRKQLQIGGVLIFDRILKEIQAMRWSRKKCKEVRAGHTCCDPETLFALKNQSIS